MVPTNRNELSTLIDLQRLSQQHRNWEAISARLESHPHEASIKHRLGYSPLEVALRCEQTPPTVIRSFLRAYPSALLRGRKGWTPLFTACSYNQSIHTIQILLDAHPPAASQ
eukprot:10131615-Ditylum_brightwellii.AAC.1